jgi:hypothetical protein
MKCKSVTDKKEVLKICPVEHPIPTIIFPQGMLISSIGS